MGYWGGMGGGWGGHWDHQPPSNDNRDRNRQGQQGLRRSVDAWDDRELGAAYNHEVVMRLLQYIKPYKFKALLAIIGVVGYAFALNISPRIIGAVVDAAVRGDASSVTRNGILFVFVAVGVWLFQYMNLINAGWIRPPRSLPFARRDVRAAAEALAALSMTTMRPAASCRVSRTT